MQLAIHLIMSTLCLILYSLFSFKIKENLFLNTLISINAYFVAIMILFLLGNGGNFLNINYILIGCISSFSALYFNNKGIK